MKKMPTKINSILANTALAVTKSNANKTCVFILHQPKLPEGANKLRKF